MLERKTTISSNVQHELESSEHPISVSQIMENLEKKNLFPNKTTIYRILDKLLQKQTINEVILKNGVSYYEIKKKHHHHHFICNDCETIFCLDTCHVHQHDINLESLLPNQKFTIKSHDFNIYGNCGNC